MMRKILFAFLLGAVLSGSLTYMHVSAAPEVYQKEVITVHTGDTLWDIASSWKQEDEDVREVIWRIQTENNLTSSELMPGQQLRVPVRSESRETGLMMASRSR